MILSEIAFTRTNFPQDKEKRGREEGEKDAKRDKTVALCCEKEGVTSKAGLIAFNSVDRLLHSIVRATTVERSINA